MSEYPVDEAQGTAEEASEPTPPPAPAASEPDPDDGPDDGSDDGPDDGSDEEPELDLVDRRPAPGTVVSFSFNLAKIDGKGEDAEPIVRDGRELGLVAVFDGMGGAGGTVYETPDGPHSGAYLASRLVRDTVEHRMLQVLDPRWNLDGAGTARDLHRLTKQALTERLAELKAPASGLRSRLLRALPTTMALMALQRREPGGQDWVCHVFWAGDSRCYLLDPQSGAQQLSLDDLRDGGDAMANLREDSVLSNVISADTDFTVHHRQLELVAPFVVLAATDGCFGYLPSPMHFEHLVLSALQESSDAGSWSAAVQSAVGRVTGDDASMAVLGVGSDHQGFRSLFASRCERLRSTWVAPLNELDAQVQRTRQQLEALRHQLAARQQDLWAEYKQTYERRLRPVQEVS